MSKSARIIVAVTLLLVGAAGYAGLKFTKPKPTPVEVTEKTWPVTTVAVSPDSHRPVLALFGRIESPRIATLAAALGADVASVEVREGNPVAKGATLIALDDRDAQLLLRQREAELAEVAAQIATEMATHENNQRALAHEQRLLDLSRRGLRRTKKLAQRNLGAQSQVDTSEQDEAKYQMALEARQLTLGSHESRLAQLKAKSARAQALLDRAALDVRRAQATAPFPGIVTKVHVAPGDRVRINDPLVSLVDTDQLEVRAQIPSRHLATIRALIQSNEALEAHASLDGETLELRLDRLAAEAAVGRGGVDGLFRIIEAPSWVQVGRTIELLLTLPAESKTVVVPTSAIHGADRIYKIVGDRLEAVTIERIGEVRDDTGRSRALVRAPTLEANTKLLATQLPNAVDGLQVRELAQPVSE